MAAEVKFDQRKRRGGPASKNGRIQPCQAVPPQADLKEIRDGLGQLQQAIDAIAVEVERLSEGQRFTTKLLSERAREVAHGPPAVREP